MSIIQGLTKTILYVKDIDTQTEFYRDKLGLTVKNKLSIDGRPDKQWVEFDTGQCTLVLHGNLETQMGKDRPKLAFSVSDIERAHHTLTQSGLKLSPIRCPSPGVKIAEGVDTEGNPFTIDCQE
jgi:predicted enzyme related to lactoylglutathione lyase